MRRKLQKEAPAFVMYRFWADKKKICCQKLPGLCLQCLFCGVSCPTLYALLKHCSLCHPRLNFHYTVSAQSAIDLPSGGLTLIVGTQMGVFFQSTDATPCGLLLK